MKRKGNLCTIVTIRQQKFLNFRYRSKNQNNWIRSVAIGVLMWPIKIHMREANKQKLISFHNPSILILFLSSSFFHSLYFWFTIFNSGQSNKNELNKNKIKNKLDQTMWDSRYIWSSMAVKVKHTIQTKRRRRRNKNNFSNF